MLVFTADLEEVEEIGGRCVDGDEVLVGRWDGVRKGRDCEVLRALGLD